MSKPVLSISCRAAERADIPAMSRIRAAEWGTEEYWVNRITGYLDGTHNPQKALPPRIIYVAHRGDVIIGFIAGHLTERFQCDGELEWINVVLKHRGSGASPHGSSTTRHHASASTATLRTALPSASTRGTAQNR